jgi:hypothetical protein
MNDCNNGNFSNTLLSTSVLTSYSITSVAAGTTCNFGMRVQNVIGYGPYSDTLKVFFAEVPSAPLAPTFVDRSGGDTLIELTPYI